MHATIPKGNIWDMMHTLFMTTVPVEPTFVAFLWHSQTHSHGLSYQFFQISLKNSELKSTHNAFQDCHVHFYRQPFSKYLYKVENSEVTEPNCDIYFTNKIKSIKDGGITCSVMYLIPICEEK